MQLFYTNQISLDKNSCFLTEEDSYHCIKVLRKKEGEIIQITDGQGNLITGVIANQDSKKTFISINSISLSNTNKNKKLTIAIAPTKNIDRIEWFVEKATELGIGKFIFINTDRGERSKINLERLQKISISAMKQSNQLFLPEIINLIKLKELMQHCTNSERFVAHCGKLDNHLFNSINSENKTIILIGPEGDFTDKEIIFLEENEFKSINLGPNRLRTETAGLAAVMMYQLKNLVQ